MTTDPNLATTSNNSAPYRLRPLWALGQGIRATWDKLGLVLAMSLMWSIALMFLLVGWQKLFRHIPAVWGNLLGAGVITLEIGRAHV